MDQTHAEFSEEFLKEVETEIIKRLGKIQNEESLFYTLDFSLYKNNQTFHIMVEKRTDGWDVEIKKKVIIQWTYPPERFKMDESNDYHLTHINKI